MVGILYLLQEATVQLYAKDEFRRPSDAVETHLLDIGKCLGLHIKTKVGVSTGCYQRAVVGYSEAQRDTVRYTEMQ